MKTIVIESEIDLTEDVRQEERGVAVILEPYDPNREGDQLVFVRIHSYDYGKKHAEMSEILSCKKIRITIEEME